jgi:hypothetical protein
MSVSSGTQKDADTLRVNAEMLMKGVFDWIDTKDVEVEKYYKKLFAFLDTTLGDSSNEVKKIVGFTESLESYKSAIRMMSESYLEDEGNVEGIKLVQLDIDDIVNSEKSAGYSDATPFNISKYFRDLNDKGDWDFTINVSKLYQPALASVLTTEISPQQVDKTWLDIVIKKEIPMITLVKNGETWEVSQEDKVLFTTLQMKGIVQVRLQVDLGGAVTSYYNSSASEYFFEMDRVFRDRLNCQCLNQTTTQCVCEVPQPSNKDCGIPAPCY